MTKIAFSECLLSALVFQGLTGFALAGEAPEPKKAHLPVMTWFHPVLEPGVSDILLLCTVDDVKKSEPKYGNDYWMVTLRINERLYVAERYTKRLAGVLLIETGDFRKRTKGEQLLLFAGGEPYDGDDFLLPCWSGTNSDLGIVFHPPDHDDAYKDQELLKQLRDAAKGQGKEADLLEAFAEFSPKGVAHHLIMRLRMEQWRKEEAEETAAKAKTK